GVNNDLQVTSNLRRYLLSTGYVFGAYGSDWTFEPSLMFQYKAGTKESSIDINAKAYKQMEFGNIWGGLSYRQSLDGAQYLTNSIANNSQKLQYIAAVVGVNYDQFMFAYRCTYQTNSVV